MQICELTRDCFLVLTCYRIEISVCNPLNDFAIVKDCLGNCGLCYLERFVKVEDIIIAIRDNENLSEQLMHVLES